MTEKIRKVLSFPSPVPAKADYQRVKSSYSIREIKQMFGLSERTIRRWAEVGIIYGAPAGDNGEFTYDFQALTMFRRVRDMRAQGLTIKQIEAELQAYFSGRSLHFVTPIALGGSKFQHAVWRALLEIPFGETRSYADIAIRIGRPAAVRAVGAANGANPIAIVIPCHRVIASDGTPGDPEPFSPDVDQDDPFARWNLQRDAAPK